MRTQLAPIVRTARRYFGLSRLEFAKVLGLQWWQYMPLDAGLKRPDGTIVALIDSFYAGFRPANWPEGKGGQGTESAYKSPSKGVWNGAIALAHEEPRQETVP